MTQRLEEYLLSHGFKSEPCCQVDDQGIWYCANFNHGRLVVKGDDWDSKVFLIYESEVETKLLNDTRAMIVNFLSDKWGFNDEYCVWREEEKLGKVTTEKLDSKTLKAKSYVHHYCSIASLKNRQKEYDDKYSGYRGWKISGYNKYYQYRATAKRFLMKNATEQDLIFMKAIIEEALGSKS